MATVKNKQGESFEVSDVDAVKMQQSDPSLEIVGDVRTSPDESGDATVSMPGNVVATQAGQGPATAGEQGAFRHKEFLADKTSTGGAALRGVASGITGGLSDYFVDPTTTEADEAHHGTLRTIAQVGGAVLPGLVMPEGALGGLFRDGAAVESTGAGLSSEFLTTGRAAGEAESAGRGLENGLVGAKRAMDGAKDAGIGLESADHAAELAGLDAKGLRAARETEVDRLTDVATNERKASVGDLNTYRQSLRTDGPWLVVEGEDAAELTKTNRTVRNALGNVKGLENRPDKLLDALQRQEQAFKNTLGNADEIKASFAATNAKLAEKLTTAIADTEAGGKVALEGKLAKRYSQFTGEKLANKTIELEAAKANDFLDALKNGQVTGASEAQFGKLPDLLKQNQALQARIEASTVAKSEFKSPRLAAIDNAKDMLTSAKPGKENVVETLLKGSVFGKVSKALEETPLGGVAHVIGAKAADIVGRLAFGRAGELAAEGAAHVSQTAKVFLDAASRSPAIPISATRILAGTAFGPSAPTEGKQDLPVLFAKRSAELRSIMEYGPSGPQMTQGARQAMAARLDPIRAHDPVLADKLETMGNARLAFIFSKMPKMPDAFATLGPNSWQPSHMEMAQWARYITAVEDPRGVEKRLLSGQVTPEDSEAYHALYPERAANLKQEIIAGLPQLQKQLPYQRRLALSMFSGVPVDPSMNPQVIAVFQASFAAEPGTEGGTQAPRANPQFGSVKKSVPEPTAGESASQSHRG